MLTTERHRDIADLAHEMKLRGDAFAIATVVRTVSVTAAKPGAKAIIDQNGQIIEGWIGGGCARHAVLKAAVNAIADGEARLVSIQPEELMKDQDDDTGYQVVSAVNMCPSKGSMDIFVEPVLANPQLLIIGDSPVARSLATIGNLFDLKLKVVNIDTATGQSDSPADLSEQAETTHAHRYIVVATQGAGDMQALEWALSLESRHVGFVGSARKIEHLQNKLIAYGLDETRVLAIMSPAGIDINAVTPQEIALSIIAEIVRLRRSKNHSG